MNARFVTKHDELRRSREEYEASQKGPDEELALVAKRKREKKERRRAAERHAAAAAEQYELEAAMRVKAKAKADAEALTAAKVEAAIRAVHKQAAQAEAAEAARTQAAVAASREAAKTRAAARAAQAERQRRTAREERCARAAARERQAAHERAQADLQEYEDLEAALFASMEQLRVEVRLDEEAAAVATKHDTTPCVAESETRVFRECVVCMATPPSHVLIPCGHLCLCMACSVALEQCPICRAHVRSTMRVFFAAS